MTNDIYQLWPIRTKRNIAMFGKRKGHAYWRFGMGSAWVTKNDGTKRLLGWSFFIGPRRLIFGKTNVLAELDALKSPQKVSHR